MKMVQHHILEFSHSYRLSLPVVEKYVYPSKSCAKKSEKYIFTHRSSSTGMKSLFLIEYEYSYIKSKYRYIFQMRGVGQSTILEHHLVSGKFVLKFGCIAVFIYQNDYVDRLNQQLHNILSKYPTFQVKLSMQKVKVLPTRNEIHSNVQIQYRYDKGKTCDFIHKNRIFYNPLRISA